MAPHRRLLSLVPLLAEFPVATLAAAPVEGRALYVTRWHMTNATEVNDAATYAADHGFNMLFCQVYGDAEAMYDSAVSPRSHLVSAGFDALAEAVAAGHAAGLEVHAYINTLRVWSGDLGYPDDPQHIVNAFPAWFQESAAGVRDVDLAVTPGAALYCCPLEPAFVEYLTAVVREIASHYEIDGIHLDYTRYPENDHCFCARHRDAFRAQYGHNPELGEPAFERFKEEAVFDVVMALRGALQEERPLAALSATLINPSGRKGQDAQRWFEGGAIDIGVPMLYTDDNGSFEDSLAWFHERSGGRHLMPSISAGGATPGAQIDIARTVGAEGVALFALNTITPAVTAEIDARFGAEAAVPPMPWLDGSPDEADPVISAVRATGVAAREATIIWHTDEKTNGSVDYGTTAAYGNTETLNFLAFEHAFTLGDLTPATTYHFRVRAEDAAGNTAESGDATFATAAEGDLAVILDDGDDDVTFTGSWAQGTATTGYAGDYRYAVDQTSVTATAQYRPFLPRGGTWEVAVTYVPGTNRVQDAPFTVEYAGGSETFTINQKERAELWIVLGSFDFEAGWGGAVILTNQASGGDVIIADAVRWRYAGPPPNPPFMRGDANDDGDINLADVITILAYLFAEKEITVCLDALDVGDTGDINISAPIRLLSYLFADGEPPGPPFPGKGHDPTPTDEYVCGD
jgi:uncharacterized lipoprotein YddW (UPF0748 family)